MTLDLANELLVGDTASDDLLHDIGEALGVSDLAINACISLQVKRSTLTYVPFRARLNRFQKFFGVIDKHMREAISPKVAGRFQSVSVDRRSLLNILGNYSCGVLSLSTI